MEQLDRDDVQLTSDEIGQGGRYRIVRAYCAGREVAAKSVINVDLDDARITDRDLEQEHAALERLDHPTIPRTRGLWRDPNTGLLHHVMEFRQGRTLQDVVVACVEKNRGQGARSWLDPVTTDIFGQICSALAHAHSRRVIHNDVGPRNVHVDLEDGELRVSLIDFEASGDGSRGSVPYSAPERMEGEPGTAQTDIYSVAVLIFYVLSGVEPWPTRDANQARAERKTNALDDLRDDISRTAWRLIRDSTPAYVQTALLRATAWNPHERQSSMRQFMRELNLSASEPPPRRQPTLTWTAMGLAAAASLTLISPLRDTLVLAILRPTASDNAECRREAGRVASALCATRGDLGAVSACNAILQDAVTGVSTSRCQEQLNALIAAESAQAASTHP